MNNSMTNELDQIKNLISATFAKREMLKNEMQEWYERFPTSRFPLMQELIVIDGTLSQLDTHYKNLWDFYCSNKQSAL